VSAHQIAASRKEWGEGISIAVGWHSIGQKSVRATLGTERVCVSGGVGSGRGWGRRGKELRS